VAVFEAVEDSLGATGVVPASLAAAGEPVEIRRAARR
jgi:hypothetical protein